MSEASDATLKCRLLIPSGLPRFADGLILITAGGLLGSQAHEVRLTLTAPGLESLDDIRTALCAWLMESLLRLNVMLMEPWVHSVGIQPHFESGEPEIVVTINDPQFLGERSTGLILEAARTFMTPVAAASWRRLIVLKDAQRFVPLDFMTDDVYRGSMSVLLPAGLEFVRPRLATVRYDQDRRVHARNFLTAALEMALDVYEPVGRVEARSTQNGLCIEVTFGSGSDVPPPIMVNDIQRTIAQVLQRHARYTDLFGDLVFDAIRPYCDEADGEYNEDEGFLGEFREY